MKTGENIFKRKDGRWEARFHKGRNSSGKIVYGYCYGRTYTEAKKKAETARQNYLQHKSSAVKTTKRSMSYYCTSWLESNRIRLRDSTYIKYDGFICNHINPYFGNQLPSEINSSLTASFSKMLLEEKNLSSKTVRDILAVLNSIISFTSGMLQNQMEEVKIVYPNKTESEIRVLSVEEQETLTCYLLDNLDESKFGILLALTTGVRIGELCALQWKHISMENKTLRVDSSIQRMKNLSPDAKSKTVVVIGPPKSHSSIRVIPLTDSVLTYCHQLYSEDSNSFVLTGTQHYMEPRTLQRRFAKYISACKLENVTVHTCRHTFATRCIEAGFEIKSLSEIMGHANVSITMNRYVHCSMELKRKNIEKVQWPGIP